MPRLKTITVTLAKTPKGLIKDMSFLKGTIPGRKITEAVRRVKAQRPDPPGKDTYRVRIPASWLREGWR